MASHNMIGEVPILEVCSVIPCEMSLLSILLPWEGNLASLGARGDGRPSKDSTYASSPLWSDQFCTLTPQSINVPVRKRKSANAYGRAFSSQNRSPSLVD
jgi:hypothetical protein